MANQPQGDSIWGNINTCMEIALDIYAIIATDENGIEHTGIMVRKSTAEKTLSPKAVSMAVQDTESLSDSEWLYYDEETQDIPMYEVLQRRVAACKRIEDATLKQIAEIKRDGKLSLTDYFGECNPPTDTQYGVISHMYKIRNGIFFTQDSTDLQFAVHEAVADNYMSPVAVEFGHKKGDYLFYDTTTCAIALNELKDMFDEVDGLIVSEDSLYATLNKNFSAYTAIYNEMVADEDMQIPKVDAPVSLFLATQLQAAKQSEQENPAQEQAEPSAIAQLPEEDFNEDTDFEVGR